MGIFFVFEILSLYVDQAGLLNIWLSLPLKYYGLKVQIFSYVYVGMSVCGPVQGSLQVLIEARKIRSPRAGVIGSYKLQDVDAGNQSPAFYIRTAFFIAEPSPVPIYLFIYNILIFIIYSKNLFWG